MKEAYESLNDTFWTWLGHGKIRSCISSKMQKYGGQQRLPPLHMTLCLRPLLSNLSILSTHCTLHIDSLSHLRSWQPQPNINQRHLATRSTRNNTLKPRPATRTTHQAPVRQKLVAMELPGRRMTMFLMTSRYVIHEPAINMLLTVSLVRWFGIRSDPRYTHAIHSKGLHHLDCSDTSHYWTVDCVILFERVP